MAYATSQDYLNWTDTTVAPAGLSRVLEVASTRIDELVIGVVYPTDDRGKPTDLDVADILLRATCEQVLYMLELGDTTGAKAGMESMTIGRVSWTRLAGARSSGAPVDERYSPVAIEILHTEGMLPVNVLRLP